MTTIRATVQVCSDDENHTLIDQIKDAEIQPDGRVKVKTDQGWAYITCRRIAEDLDLDPAEAVFDKLAERAHFYVNVPMDGKIVKVMDEQQDKRFALSPEWIRYNNVHNEGVEGHNPHAKYIQTQ